MSSSQFTEGDLVFCFPSHWGVRKYDQQRFYRHMGGMGLKGVDFIAIDPHEKGHLYLIEVKNYRTRYREGLVFEAPLKEKGELADIVTTKYKHTMRAIRAIHLFYLRKWWYQLTRQLYLDSKRLQFDVVFWTQAYQLAKQAKRHSFVLWLETEEPAKDYRVELLTEIRKRLPLPINAAIAEQSNSSLPGIEVVNKKNKATKD